VSGQIVMADVNKEKNILFLLVVGLAGWIVPGGGHFILNKKKQAVILFAAVLITFCLGLYVGSIGVVDPVGASYWYLAQIITSPFVAILGHHTAGGSYPVYGKPEEIGQLYTSMAGLLNLLCIINAVYLARLRQIGLKEG